LPSAESAVFIKFTPLPPSLFQTDQLLAHLVPSRQLLAPAVSVTSTDVTQRHWCLKNTAHPALRRGHSPRTRVFLYINVRSSCTATAVFRLYVHVPCHSSPDPSQDVTQYMPYPSSQDPTSNVQPTTLNHPPQLSQCVSRHAISTRRPYATRPLSSPLRTTPSPTQPRSPDSANPASSNAKHASIRSSGISAASHRSRSASRPSILAPTTTVTAVSCRHNPLVLQQPPLRRNHRAQHQIDDPNANDNIPFCTSRRGWRQPTRWYPGREHLWRDSHRARRRRLVRGWRDKNRG